MIGLRSPARAINHTDEELEFLAAPGRRTHRMADYRTQRETKETEHGAAVDAFQVLPKPQTNHPNHMKNALQKVFDGLVFVACIV